MKKISKIKSIKYKVVLLSLFICLISTLVIWMYNVFNIIKQNQQEIVAYEKQLRQSSDELLKNQVDTAITLINGVYQKQLEGEYTEEQAKKEAADLIRELRYGSGGYFWIDTFEGVNVVLPTKTSTEGTNRYNSKDTNGKLFIQELIKNGLQKDGGYTDYWFPKAGSNVPMPKRGYTRSFEPYKWVVGTGYYIDYIDKSVQERSNALNSQLYKQIEVQVGIFIIIIFIASILSIFISRKISEPIVKVTDLLKNISEGDGDLTQRINVGTNDEISEMSNYFNIFIEKMQHIITQAKQSANNVNEFSRTLTQTLNNNSAAMVSVLSSIEQTHLITNGISTAVQQTSVTMEEIATGATRIAGDSQDVVKTISSIENAINEGERSSENTAEQMNIINEETNVLSSISGELKDSVTQITQIIDTINSIAEQTNLLALNAAIESARAGEDGRGFAVVAEEIRKLAEMSRSSTKSIKELLEQVTNKTMVTLKSVSEVSDRITTGHEMVQRVHKQFQEISTRMKNILELAENTSANTEEQSASNEEVTAVVNDIVRNAGRMQENMNITAKEVQQQTNQIKELGKSTAKLYQDTQNLNELLNKFKV